MEVFNVSDQIAEQTSGEPGSLGAGPAVSHSSRTQWEQGEISFVESPRIAPDHEAPEADQPRVQAPKVEVLRADAPKAEAAKAEAAKAEALKPEAARPDAARAPGKLLIMSAGERWDRDTTGPDIKSGSGKGFSGKRLAALAAMVVLAVVAGALGGALLTAGLTQFAGVGALGLGNAALEASVARIDADIVALKASIEHTSQLEVTQFNKTSDRLDRVEKAQAEPLAKLAKLGEAVEKLRATPPAPALPVAAAAPAPASAAAKEVTGAITPPVPAPPKVEVARLPIVDGWVLRDVSHGSALIEGRQGMYEVFAGDPIPGLGKVDAIRRQDGRWVVVTSKGLIVAR
jgi:hypothetical protein